jgi:hypothetical protein
VLDAEAGAGGVADVVDPDAGVEQVAGGEEEGEHGRQPPAAALPVRRRCQRPA